MKQLRNAGAKFTCPQCGQEWFLIFPVPMLAVSYNALMHGVLCPTCGDRKQVLMSKVRVLPDDDEQTLVPALKAEDLKTLLCLHCGQSFLTEDKTQHAKAIELFKEHDSTCPDHPLTKRVKELEARLAEIEGATK